MIDHFSWPSIFAPAAGLGMVSFLLATRALRDSRDPAARGLDWAGALSFTAALALLTYGILLAPERGWGDAQVMSYLIGGALLLVAFGSIERRVARPMLDLSLFRYPRFVGVQLLAAAPAYAFVVLLILLPIRFVGIEGMSVLAAGQLMIALSAPLLVLPIAAGLLAHWLKPSVICGIGLLISAAGLFWLSRLAVGAAPELLAAPLVLIGVGISLPWGLMDALAVSVVPKERAGMATGIFSTTRVAGEGVALAVVSAALSSLIATELGHGATQAAQRLVTGDLAGAAAALPTATKAGLIQSYSSAFDTLATLLSGITVCTALVVFSFLGRGAALAQDSVSPAPEDARSANSA